MAAKTMMIQGTSSSVGKSLVVAGLCRIFNDDGYRVAPFKSQNMALNSSVTLDGYEISRSQTMQAEAARAIPIVEMNPVLLKPKGDHTAQVIFKGRPYGDFGAREYREQLTPLALQVASECLDYLRETNQVVVIEGAGSPAEINLRENDIANMKIAELAEAPVLLVGDIDRGGCLAAIVGTLELLTPAERARVKGIIINKFRGDIGLLEPGLKFLTERTGIPILGVLPYLELELPEEDSQGLKAFRSNSNTEPQTAKILVGVIKLPRIANFTDYDALAGEPDVELRFVTSPGDLDSCDLIILPGTKNTTIDLIWLKETGLAAKISELSSRVTIFGICGGYQMLGQEVCDPQHLESEFPLVTGLKLLPISTGFISSNKVTKQVQAKWFNRAGITVPIIGYEIHHGVSEITGSANLFHLESGDMEGYRVGNIYGTYIHGCLDNDEFRWELLEDIRILKKLTPQPKERSYKNIREDNYCLLAAIMRRYLDIPAIYQLMGITDGFK